MNDEQAAGVLEGGDGQALPSHPPSSILHPSSSILHPPSSSQWRLGLLVVANCLAAVGGGRGWGAGKGVTGLALLGGGSLLAFLVGSAVGLGLLVAARRYAPGRALAVLSIATVISSLALLAILWSSASQERPLMAMGT